MIPITEDVDWYQYNTEDFAGWVTQRDPYAAAGRLRRCPDWGVMLLHLTAEGLAHRRRDEC